MRDLLASDARADAGLPEPLIAYFRGSWEQRHLFNVPGPFYGAETGTCCCRPIEEPANVLYDDDGMEFVWRQPQDGAQLAQVLRAAWRGARGLRDDRAERPRHDDPARPRALRGFRVYFDRDLEDDLRRYACFLEKRRAPTGQDTLPDLTLTR